MCKRTSSKLSPAMVSVSLKKKRWFMRTRVPKEKRVALPMMDVAMMLEGLRQEERRGEGGWVG